jgi:hypothetical protein
MAVGNVLGTDERDRLHSGLSDHVREPASAVSWGAIIAGAAAAAVLSLLLLMLGVGLGLSSVSPWASQGIDASTFGVSTIVWLTVTQLLASGLGGYIAGRLRTKWVSVHSDEVHFRDTAHGFLAWAVATLVTASLLSSAIGSILGAGVQAGAEVAKTVPSGMSGVGKMLPSGMSMGGDSGVSGDSGAMGYVVDSLFRGGKASAGTNANAAPNGAATAQGTAGAQDNNPSATASEAGRILANALSTGSLPAQDSEQLSRLVAQRTGLSHDEAQKRVASVFAAVQDKMTRAQTAAKEVADKARKGSAYGALWLFVTLLIGAFVASLAATRGGRQRDL